MVYLKQILKVSLMLTMMWNLSTPVCVASSFQKGDLLRVSTSEALLKSSPHPFGSKVLKKLIKGSSVAYIETSGIYYRVSYKQETGFIASKSVIDIKKFKSFSRSGGVTQSDMAAATKGFSAEVEKENRKNKKLRYDLIDKAEKLSTVVDSDSKFRVFRKEGMLGEYAHE